MRDHIQNTFPALPNAVAALEMLTRNQNVSGCPRNPQNAEHVSQISLTPPFPKQ
jgi:hypothetical protein